MKLCTKRMLSLCLTLGLSMLLLLLLPACQGGRSDTSTDTDPVGEATPTEAPTQPEEVTEPETQPQPAETVPETQPEDTTLPETETEDPNLIPTVADDVIGVANVAPEGFAMASSTLQATKRSNMYVNDLATDSGFSSGDFTSADAEAWLFIDLGEARTIRSVVIKPLNHEPQFFPISFDVQVSDDGQTWTTVQSFSGMTDVSGDGVTATVDGVTATFVRILVREMAAKEDAYHYSIGELEVMADITATTNMILRQDNIWLYDDTSATLAMSYRRLANVAEDATLRFISADPSIVDVDHSTGLLTPTGYGDTVVYAYDGINLTACKVRVIDERETSVRVSTFYHSNFGYPQYMEQVLDYMRDAGIDFLEDTRSYDAVGNQICDYLMYLCAERDIFLSVCDPLNGDKLAKAKDDAIIELVQKYENRAGFGGLYLVDEPHEESNDYAHVARVIRAYNYHVTPHLNLLPIGGFPSWDEYVSEYCAITGGTHRMTYLSYDNYCFMAGGGFNWGVYNSLNKIRQYGLKYNASTGYYMQAMEIRNSYRISSDTELMLNASMGVAYGFKNFKWFVYLTPIGSGEAFTTGLIASDFTPSVMYNGVTAANARIHEAGRILGNCDAIEVYHSDSIAGNEKLPDDFALTQVTRFASIYTLYKSLTDNTQYIVVVNRNYGATDDKTFTLKLADDLHDLEIYADGNFTKVDVAGDKTFSVFIPAGDFVIFRLPAWYDARRPEFTKSGNLAEGCAAFVTSSQYTFWTASDIASYHLTDGDTANGGWKSALRDSDPVIILDLVDRYNVSNVKLFPLVGESTTKLGGEIRIEVSLNGTDWTEVYTTAEATTDGTAPWSCDFDTTAARYIRITLSGRNRALGEIEVY